MQQPLPPRRISLAKRIAFSAAIIGVTFVVLEAAMILLEPHLFRGFFQYDADLGFKVRPYANGSNRFGFNEHDYALAKPDNVYRILVLGDSFNWAGSRKWNYTVFMQKQFDRKFGANQVQIINAGYPMTHTAEQLDILKKYGLQYEPDFVLLGFFLGNDFMDADPNRKRIVVNGAYFDIDRRYEMTLLGYPVIPQSRLLVFIWQQLRVLKEFGLQAAQAMSETTFIHVRQAQLEFFDRNQQQDHAYRDNIEYILNAVTTMDKLLEKKGIGFAVGLFPDQLQVDQDLFHHIVDTMDRERDEFELTLPNRILTAHLDKQRIPHVDLLPAFRQQHLETQLYIDLDTHWNHAGNRLAARILFDFLLEQTASGLKP